MDNESLPGRNGDFMPIECTPETWVDLATATGDAGWTKITLTSKDEKYQMHEDVHSLSTQTGVHASGIA